MVRYMNDIDKDKLYEIYLKNNKGLLSKFTFNRIMNNKKTYDCIEKLRSIFLGKYRKSNFPFDDQKLYVGFFNLLNKYSFSKLYKMLENYNENDSSFNEEIFSIIGMKYPDVTKNLNLDFALNLICNDFVDFNYLLSLYGETIYNSILSVDEYFYSTPMVNDINSYDDFLKYRASNSSDDKLVGIFNEFFYIMTRKYTVEELLNESDKVKKEIATGITNYIPDLISDRTNDISDNREIFDKMADYFDSRTLMILLNAKSYLKPIENLINSNGMTSDDLMSLKEIYTMFYNIYNFELDNNYQGILELIETTVNNNQNGLNFCDIINDYVLTYESLIRKNIVENINTFENVPMTNFSYTDSNGLTSSVNCALVSNCSQLESTMVHIFNNKPSDQSGIAIDYIVNVINTFGEYALINHSRSKENIKQVIVQLCNILGNYTHFINPNRDVKKEIQEKIKRILTPEEIELCDNKYKLFEEHYQNHAEVTQITKVSDVLYNFLIEETDNFKKPLTSDVTNYEEVNRKLSIISSPFNENVLATQVLRLNSYQDFAKLILLNERQPYKLAVSFDKNGMSEDSIMISSTDNIESNNIPIADFFRQYPLERRSASLDMLRNTVGVSDMTNRANNEIDLIRSSVAPQNLLIFFNRPINDKTIEGIKMAEQLAKKSNLKLVLVDYQSICNELKSKENMELSRKNNHEDDENIILGMKR